MAWTVRGCRCVHMSITFPDRPAVLLEGGRTNYSGRASPGTPLWTHAVRHNCAVSLCKVYKLGGTWLALRRNPNAVSQISSGRCGRAPAATASAWASRCWRTSSSVRATFLIAHACPPCSLRCQWSTPARKCLGHRRVARGAATVSAVSPALVGCSSYPPGRARFGYAARGLRVVRPWRKIFVSHRDTQATLCVPAHTAQPWRTMF